MNLQYCFQRLPRAVLMWCLLLSGCVLLRSNSAKSQAFGSCFSGCFSGDTGDTSSGCNSVEDSSVDTANNKNTEDSIEGDIR